MPEGDIVWLTARRLDAALRGRALTAADLRVPALATADLRRRVVLGVAARGKHLLARLDDGRTLHSHLGMAGAWRVGPTGGRLGAPAHAVRAVLVAGEVSAVGLRLRVLELLDTAAEARAVGHLGPDPLGEDWDAAAALARLAARPERPIGEALLDQRVVAGLGTIYRAEALFCAGVNPWTPVGAVADPAAVLGHARRLLLANREDWRQDTRDGRRGQWVYERAGLPCRRCGTIVRRGELGDPARRVFWCPACQPQAAATT